MADAMIAALEESQSRSGIVRDPRTCPVRGVPNTMPGWSSGPVAAGRGPAGQSRAGHSLGPVPVLPRGRVRSRSLRLGGLVGVAVAVAALTAGCEQSPDGGSSSAAAATQSSPTAQRADVVDKIAIFGRDECATEDAASVYPQCARFVREVSNVTVAARAVASGPTEEAAVGKAADAVDAAVDRLTRDACLLPPGQGPTGTPQSCGPDLAALQAGVRDLGTAFGG